MRLFSPCQQHSNVLDPRHDDNLSTLSELSEAANRKENNADYTTSTPFKTESFIDTFFDAAKASRIATIFFLILTFILVDVMLSS